MTKMPSSVKVTMGLLAVNALIWVLFAIILIADLHPAAPESERVKLAMAILALMLAVMLVGAMFLLMRQNGIVFYLTIGLLLVIASFTVADQFGLADLVVLIITLLPIGFLVKDRALYLQS